MNQITLFASSPAFIPVAVGWTSSLSIELHRLGMIGAAWQAEALESRIAELADDLDAAERAREQAGEEGFDEGRRDRDAEVNDLEKRLDQAQKAAKAFDDELAVRLLQIDDLQAQLAATEKSQRVQQEELIRLALEVQALEKHAASAVEVETIDYSAAPLPTDPDTGEALPSLDFTARGAIPEAVAPVEPQPEPVTPAPTPAAPAADSASPEAMPQPWFDDAKIGGWSVATYRRKHVGTSAILVDSDESIGYQLFIHPEANWICGFVGLCKKPFASGTYTPDRQQAWTDAIERARAKELNRREKDRARRAERAEQPHELAVGDVLRAMWGYDQTNVDYYEVTRLIGKSMVEVREIGALSENTGDMQGDCAPSPGHYIGEPQRCRPSGRSVRIDSVRTASKIEPKAVIAGKPIYGASHWTAYH